MSSVSVRSARLWPGAIAAALVSTPALAIDPNISVYVASASCNFTNTSYLSAFTVGDFSAPSLAATSSQGCSSSSLALDPLVQVLYVRAFNGGNIYAFDAQSLTRMPSLDINTGPNSGGAMEIDPFRRLLYAVVGEDIAAISINNDSTYGNILALSPTQTGYNGTDQNQLVRDPVRNILFSTDSELVSGLLYTHDLSEHRPEIVEWDATTHFAVEVVDSGSIALDPATTTLYAHAPFVDSDVDLYDVSNVGFITAPFASITTYAAGRSASRNYGMHFVQDATGSWLVETQTFGNRITFHDLGAGTTSEVAFNRPHGIEYYPLDLSENDDDGDGIPDTIEVGAVGLPDLAGVDELNDAEPSTRTNPNAADTDGDGIDDGVEDANRDGSWDPELGETNPSAADSDRDRLDDLEEILGPDGIEGTGDETDPLDLDSDDDGVSDSVELQISTDPNNPDTDGDGLTDGRERDEFGTDPTVFSTDGDCLGDGEEADQAPLSDPLVIEDIDGDGLTDQEECDLGMDPYVVDTDGDGLGDGDEVDTYNTDPTLGDTDGDGLDDGSEVRGDGLLLGYGPTNPNSVDTDGDGLEDGDEVVGPDGALASGDETHPNDADSDDDDLTDGEEFLGADGDPATPDGTDPNDPDTDRDGLEDGAELAGVDGIPGAGGDATDPNNPDTDGDNVSDGDEVLAVGDVTGFDPTDPLDTDSDDDGLPDGAEVPGADGVPNSGDETDPNRADSDGDRLLDGDELAGGTDPRDPDSDGDGLDDGTEVLDEGTDPLEPDTDLDGLVPGGRRRGRHPRHRPPRRRQRRRRSAGRCRGRHPQYGPQRGRHRR